MTLPLEANNRLTPSRAEKRRPARGCSISPDTRALRAPALDRSNSRADSTRATGAAAAARRATTLSPGEQPRETSTAVRAAVVVGPQNPPHTAILVPHPPVYNGAGKVWIGTCPIRIVGCRLWLHEHRR